MTTFDTLKATKRLMAAGFDSTQAEAQAETIREALAEGVATRADLADVKADIARLEGKIDSLDARLTARMYGLAVAIVAAQTALTVSLLRMFGGAG